MDAIITTRDGAVYHSTRLPSVLYELTRGETQTEIAEKAGMSQAQVSEAFNAKSIAGAVKIIKAYGGRVHGPYYGVELEDYHEQTG